VVAHRPARRRWDGARAEIRAAVAAVRYNPDPGAQAEPRAERLAAIGLGLLVLVGATATYLILLAFDVRA